MQNQPWMQKQPVFSEIGRGKEKVIWRIRLDKDTATYVEIATANSITSEKLLCSKKEVQGLPTKSRVRALTKYA